MDNKNNTNEQEVLMNHRGIDDKRKGAIGKRFADARAQSKFQQLDDAELGKVFGVSYESIRQWCKGGKLPSIAHVIAASDLFDISLDWLLLGRGEMRFSDKIKGKGPIKGETIDISTIPNNVKDVIRGMVALHQAKPETKDKK
jgi:transcriptional regulator with XRE-family HTH domain